jgi:NAD(P)-dependent dehydrogenase (short-subunit alcohol dehydrogenase family)
MNLAGVIVIPDLTYPSGPVETISPDLWSDALNVKVLGTIAITQAFLRTISEFHARLLILTPSIIPSLSPPFHAVESSIVAGLDAFTASLTKELATMAIDVISLKLGTFDLGNGSRPGGQGNQTRADVLSWSPRARAAYARNFVSQSAQASVRGHEGGVKGSPLRELHNSVFDALTVKRPRAVWRVGTGSVAYAFVGRWVPAGIVGWMLGVQRVAREDLNVEDIQGSLEWERVDQ